MTDIQNPKLMYLKAALFVVIGGMSTFLLLVEHPEWKVAGLLAVTVWAFARAYYFAFYVIQHYIDPDYRFAGLWSFFVYAATRKKRGGERDD